MAQHGHLILSLHLKTYLLIKLNLINEMITQLGQQMKNKMQVKVEINLVSHINFKWKLWLNVHSENEV